MQIKSTAFQKIASLDKQQSTKQKNNALIDLFLCLLASLDWSIIKNSLRDLALKNVIAGIIASLARGNYSIGIRYR